MLEPMAPRSHILEFDTVRAFAVLAVMQQHFWPSLTIGFKSGMLGVQVFFVLSGFLITSILIAGRQRIEDGQSSMKTEIKIFYARRFLRIFPLYYAVVFGGAILGIGAIVDYLGWHALYLTNFLVSDLQAWPYPAGVFWTLAVEEQFYLIWPFVVLMLPHRFLGPVCAVIILSAIAFRFVLSGNDPIAYHTLLFANMDALAGGALLAVLAKRGASRSLAYALLAAAIAGLVFLPKDFGAAGMLFSSQVKLTMALVGAAVIQCVLVWRDKAVLAPLRWKPLMQIGVVSYGVYLLHQFVGFAIDKAGVELAEPLMFAIKASAAIALALASWYMFEKPINGLKRFFPYPSKTAASASAATDQRALSA